MLPESFPMLHNSLPGLCFHYPQPLVQCAEWASAFWPVCFVCVRMRMEGFCFVKLFAAMQTCLLQCIVLWLFKKDQWNSCVMCMKMHA